MSKKGTTFVHNCDQCQFLGSGTYHGNPHDWYKCGLPGGRWSLVARFGDATAEYRSGGFLECTVVTPLEIRALALGLELTDTDKDRLIRVLLNEKKSRVGIREHGNYFAEEERGSLGNGKWFREEG